jgi:Replication-relaxation
VLRFLLWRMLGLIAAVGGATLLAWFLGGGPGRLLRGAPHARAWHLTPAVLANVLVADARRAWTWAPVSWLAPAQAFVLLGALTVLGLALSRAGSRSRRRYVRMRVEPYRGDHADADALVRMFETLQKRLLRRWWRRLFAGQPSLALEVHHGGEGGTQAGWLAVSAPVGLEPMVEAALRAAYPSCRLRPAQHPLGGHLQVLRLKKHAEFILRARAIDRFEHERDPPVNRLLTAMSVCAQPAFVQLALTPTPAGFEALAVHAFKRREARLSRQRRDHVVMRDRSLVEDAQLRGGLDVQHRALFFLDLRVAATTRTTCERIASELRIETGENRLVERGTGIRHGLLGLYGRRVQRGEGNPLPSFRKGVFATTELASLWQLPSLDYLTVPFARSGLPLAPAPPAIDRPRDGGALRDSIGPVSIDVRLRKQNTAVPGAVDQGKSSYLVATVAEDVRRERCAVIVLDPKGDAADAALSVIPAERTCTLLDFSHPTCGFNPLAVDAPADVIADYVVAALKNLFTDADIRASSDRYLRNAIIAVLAHDRSCNLWDAARLLSVGEEGYSYRRSVGARVRELPELSEISRFFTAELSAQLADARGPTTSKLDAPVNKLARLLNSPSIKRVLLNESLRIDFDGVIAGGQVLVVKGALGAMGAGNTSVLMQMLVGMLDAALARQQDLVPPEQRVAVALKIDEAPLVVNRGFAETMALKRSAGLETVACWQTDAQWTDRDVRDQLDALFAHRVYFATSSASDARSAVALTMAEFSDTVRPGIPRLSSLGAPDTRLHLPKHHAIASWCTAAGRQSPFVAETLAMTVDRERLAAHAARQRARGARHLSDLRQPHWDRPRKIPAPALVTGAGEQAAREAPTRSAISTRLPQTPAESYRELVELDRAQRVRWATRAAEGHPLEPDGLDIEMLITIAGLGHVLSSQLHRRFNPRRAPTTTQRRLKRLSDAGLVERLQFHRRDGGGVPMCYEISDHGLRVLAGSGATREIGMPSKERSRQPSTGVAKRDRHLREVRHEIHVAGWVLALVRVAGSTRASVRGTREAALEVPRREGADGWARLGPEQLRLPGGCVPHDFLRTDATGRRTAVERFDSLRPDAIVEIAAAGAAEAGAGSSRQSELSLDVIVERDDRPLAGRAVAKLERYEHFLTGWSVDTERYGRRKRASPLVVFVCRDRARARANARSADPLLRACRAYAGEYPFDWEYLARKEIVFAAERDLHEGVPLAYGVPTLPPEVRVAVAKGDPRAGESMVEPREILPARRERDG